VHALKARPTSSTSATSAWSAASSWSRAPASRRKRAFDVFVDCFEQGLLIRTTGDIIALSPPLIIEKSRSTSRRRHAAHGAETVA
jgi:beta-alanine--pyruvate transaminase